MARHYKPIRLNRVERATSRKLDALKRDIILEHDKLFQANMLAVQRKYQAGECPAWRLKYHRDWSVMASLRRNGVPRHEAERLVKA